MANTDPAQSTLYPKITTHIPEIIEQLRRMNRDPAHPQANITVDPVPFVGTVKLHGTHADILVYPNNRIVFQSRNLVGLSVEKDNQGFAATMSEKNKVIMGLRDMYLERWKELNPSKTVKEDLPVVVAGEWIGEKIQKDVAIAQLSRRFVIVSVNINGTWQKDEEYSDISLPAHGIYNASRAGIFHAKLYPDDYERTVSEIERMTEEVAAHCPFASSFGIYGLGEGIVWKPVAPQYNADTSLWFKSKGGKFKPTFFRVPKPHEGSDIVKERRKAAATVAVAWCSQQRLDQGWDVLREKGVQRGVRALGDFLKWIQHDILEEEKGHIKEHGVDEAALKIEIAKIAKPWYRAKLRECDAR
ncbi:uncharacterized protein J4E78_001483 [Alternaria triticimaculans]|uniref:uncharacterized protein n=1 Tax=Alternaria triticimaculans TaxID=297637 RepID=UPI0020C1E2C7|nr:uncharacterized protein J4E78_001483 [Alternaria triticimaculans]KAI4672980.1 hypothetical protein J4E78_001483 [Alternaria triticimaculans]